MLCFTNQPFLEVSRKFPRNQMIMENSDLIEALFCLPPHKILEITN